MQNRINTANIFHALRGHLALLLALAAWRTREQSPGYFLDKKGPRKFHKYYFLLALTPHD